MAIGGYSMYTGGMYAGLVIQDGGLPGTFRLSSKCQNQKHIQCGVNKVLSVLEVLNNYY